ncbi:MAG TPA: hypothetical protein VLK37_10165, partial [Solirubrobacterales bacterium]|nr:hypothetical protein [Solirubrobacterales bacterium]
MLALRRQVAIRFALGGVLLFAGLGLNAASASAASDFEFQGEIVGPSGISGSAFAKVSAVGVDEVDGMVYVLDSGTNALYKFDLEGNPANFGGASPNISGNRLSGLSVESVGPGERQVAVNPTTHVVYLTGQADERSAKVVQAFQSNGEPAVFSGTGTNEIAGSPSFLRLFGIAIDKNGAIYTSDGGQTGNGIQVYKQSGTIEYASASAGIGDSLAAAGSAGFKNIGVDGAGTLYALHFEKVEKYLPSEYPVTSTTTYSTAGVIDPNVAQGIAVDSKTDNVYVAESAPTPRVALFDKEGASLGTFAKPGEEGALKAPQNIAAASVDGRAFAFVPDSPSLGPSRVKIFAEKVCLCPPKLTATSVSAVTGDSAILRAKIDPEHLNTTYRFEYGLVDCTTGPCEEAPLGGGAIPAGGNDVKIQVALFGLLPETTYHFRVVAENSAGPMELPGTDKTFTTQASGLKGALPDGRAWEMVSPSKKFGGAIISTKETAIQASRTGGQLALASAGSIFEDAGSNRVPEPTSILAKRGSGGAWTSRDLAPPHHEATTAVHGATEFKLFTPDLMRAVMEPNEDLPLSSAHSPYLWSNGDPPSFSPLVDPSNLNSVVEVIGASSDLEHVAVRSSQGPPLVPGAAENSVYMWSGGAIDAVSELPQSEGGAVVRGVVGAGEESVRHAISDNGSRAFWTSLGLGKKGLYLRDRSAGESVRLDVKEADASGDGDNRPAFNGASADGGAVFFTDSQQLTADASSDGRDLYRCEIGEVGGGALGCTDIADISAPPAGSGESAEVIDQMPAISEDGRRGFFVARGVLDEGSSDAGEHAIAGEPNLYFWEEGQAPRLVAVLSEDDGRVWGEPNFEGSAVDISAAISPDGRYFTFTSEKSLTGYENSNAGEHSNTEVFLYDTEAEEGERLSCVSCNPSGAMAIGEQLPIEEAFFPPDPGGLWAGQWVAATLPQATEAFPTGPSLYRPRTALNNGRVFFNSVDPLVAADSNGEWDVYQYEPVGVGSCTATTNTATATRSGAGCVGLLSSGSSEGDAGFLDASESGED